MVRNVHERLLPAPVDEVGPLLDRLGGPDDVLWPSPRWEPMVLDRPVGVGAAGGHGVIRYRVVAHEPGRRVEFAFDPGQGLDGTHALSVDPAGPGRSLLRHTADARLSGGMRLLWPVAVRWMHDTVLEDLLDRAESALGGAPTPRRPSARVRLLWALEAPRARAAAVPDTPLLVGALPRVDWADAYAVDVRPGMPTDPQVWADAIFRDPPRVVRGLLGLRNALVGLAGIARGDASAFDTVARTGDEVLLGTDAAHLDFRASVHHTPDRVVLSTVVTIHNARGRAYSAVVRRIHPSIVRAMLNRAARRFAAGGAGSACGI
ncbi:MAG: DUF2867 domain-containing protein [Pseudonocardia sp.]